MQCRCLGLLGIGSQTRPSCRVCVDEQQGRKLHSLAFVGIPGRVLLPVKRQDLEEICIRHNVLLAMYSRCFAFELEIDELGSVSKIPPKRRASKALLTVLIDARILSSSVAPALCWRHISSSLRYCLSVAPCGAFLPRECALSTTQVKKVAKST